MAKPEITAHMQQITNSDHNEIGFDGYTSVIEGEWNRLKHYSAYNFN
jgi:hypothetical protein